MNHAHVLQSFCLLLTEQRREKVAGWQHIIKQERQETPKQILHPDAK